MIVGEERSYEWPSTPLVKYLVASDEPSFKGQMKQLQVKWSECKPHWPTKLHMTVVFFLSKSSKIKEFSNHTIFHSNEEYKKWLWQVCL